MQKLLKNAYAECVYVLYLYIKNLVADIFCIYFLVYGNTRIAQPSSNMAYSETVGSKNYEAFHFIIYYYFIEKKK